MKIPANASWTIRKIFKLRPLVQPWIKYAVGNGLKMFLWWNNWHPLGPLFQRFGVRLRFILRSASHAKVTSVIDGTRWKWCRAKSAVVSDIVSVVWRAKCV